VCDAPRQRAENAPRPSWGSTRTARRGTIMGRGGGPASRQVNDFTRGDAVRKPTLTHATPTLARSSLPALAIALAAALPAPAAALERLVIGVSPSLTATLSVVALKEGFFAAQGLDVDVRVIGSGNKAVTMMLDDEVDVSESTPFVLAKNAFTRRDFAIYAQVAVMANDNMIVARRDRGIRTLADLKGKRVGVLRDGFPAYVLDLMLLEAGLDASTVRIVSDESHALPSRLASGDLDAACVYGGNADQAIARLGANAIVFHDDRLVRVTVVQAARRATLEKRRPALLAALQAYARAEEWIRHHPDAALQETVEFLRLDPARARRVWTPKMIHVELEQALVKDLENLAHWQVDTGQQLQGALPNVLDFIESAPLEAVDARRVTIVR
jgi:ABC-type nitrate/sulfonate/bicarbonate transport system substrate-binding protein